METAVATIVDLFRETHQGIREVVADLDLAALDWTPGPETNSISVLTVHTLGAEAGILHLVRGLPHDRDRDAEFAAKALTADDLLALVDRTETVLAALAPAITAADLTAMRERPSRPTRSGLAWLCNNYGHAREHLAQMQLTKQLYLQRSEGA